MRIFRAGAPLWWGAEPCGGGETSPPMETSFPSLRRGAVLAGGCLWVQAVLCRQHWVLSSPESPSGHLHGTESPLQGKGLRGAAVPIGQPARPQRGEQGGRPLLIVVWCARSCALLWGGFVPPIPPIPPHLSHRPAGKATWTGPSQIPLVQETCRFLSAPPARPWELFH